MACGPRRSWTTGGVDGLVVRWESRQHRKHLKAAAAGGSTWWAPGARGWWIAVLFAVGSALFAVGSVPAYVSAVGARWDAVTYFIGSLFFTSAAFLTYREAVDAAPSAQDNPGHRRFFVYQPRRIDWWATAVQLAGTLYFNVSTGVAMETDLTAQAAHQHVWRPDADRLGLLPGGQRTGLVRGLPRLGAPGGHGPGPGGSRCSTCSGPWPSACPRWPVTSAR